MSPKNNPTDTGIIAYVTKEQNKILKKLIHKIDMEDGIIETKEALVLQAVVLGLPLLSKKHKIK